MLYARVIAKNINQIRKQHWSAPTIMTVIICFFMLLIHSFETVGILNKERNIEYRIESPENGKNFFKKS